MSVRGAAALLEALGSRLLGLRRLVMGLGLSATEFGHGWSELTFTYGTVTVGPGQNEDYLEILRGTLEENELEPSEHLDLVDLTNWALERSAGVLERVDIYADEVEDLALVFLFSEGGRFSICLQPWETDVCVGEALELFDEAPEENVPSYRTTVGLDTDGNLG